MRIALTVLAVFAALMSSAKAQGTASGVAKDVARGSKTARLPVEALCAKLTLDEVKAIAGKAFERRTDMEKTFQVCKYGDSQEHAKMQVRYFTLGSSVMTAESWRKFIEVDAKGKVIERDGMLVSHLRRNKFGNDTVWFKDRQGRALELHANSGITEDQAVALAKAAMD